jgi:hypothetical protein
LLSRIKENTPVDLLVMRKGKSEMLKGLSLPKAEPDNERRGAADFPLFPGQPFAPPDAGAMMPPGAMPLLGGMMPFGPMPGFHGAAMPGAPDSMTMVFHSGKRLTLRHQDRGLFITLTGQAEDGKIKITEIRIQDGREGNSYEDAEKVPSGHRDKVKSLIEMVQKAKP